VTTVLISGASIAGLTLAAWLERYGFEVTVVERNAGIRAGGQAIDVRGPALQVIERMGLLDAVAAQSTAIRGMSFVDGSGTELARDTTSTLSAGVIDNPDVEILRDDLLGLLHAQTTTARYLYDDTITELEQSTDSVSVTFSHNRPATFDLVVGADGLHSTVRRLTFGPESDFARRLGTFLAICTTPNFLGLDHWQTWYRDDQTATVAASMSVRDNSEARALLGFRDAELTVDYRDTQAQLRVLDQRFANSGWIVPKLLAAMQSAADFYFDEATQICMAAWTSGRIALVGDAAYCCSPAGGQGSSVALIGAYTLAGELQAARHDGPVHHRDAYQAFEAHLRPYVDACQSLALETLTNTAVGSSERFFDVINSIDLKNYS
jgi:2-polyprenyl-6-methoxyphenol hydroxylase-like FAD-dependent oxidoreductase